MYLSNQSARQSKFAVARRINSIARSRAKLQSYREGRIPRAMPAFIPNRAPQQTKYFDVSGAAAIGSGNDWASTELVCANYIQSDGTTVGAYTDAALLPSAVGAGYGQIQGNKFYIKKLRVKGTILTTVLVDQADVSTGQTIRISLVQDTQPNGAQAQGENIYTDLGGADEQNQSFLQMGAASAGRFRILKDELLQADVSAVGTDGTNTQSVGHKRVAFNFTWQPKKPFGVRIQANSATPTVASLSDCNIFLIAHGSKPGTCVFASRCYFCD